MSDIGLSLDGPALAEFSPLILRVLTAAAQLASTVMTVTEFTRGVWIVGREELQPNSAKAWAEVLEGSERTNFADSLLTDQPNKTFFLSPGLAAAFAEAKAIRLRLGGRDSFIGLRHVLAAFCSSSSGSLTGQEFDLTLSSFSLTREALAGALLRNAISRLEPGESGERWAELLKSLVPIGAPAKLTFSSLTEAADDNPPQSSAQGVPTALHRARENQAERLAAQNEADDPWQPGIVDRGQVKREAEAFALMAISRAASPPLAVGVFGDWGSGKSFFLRLVHDAVRNANQGIGENQDFHTNIVQIRFNAWHYAETNLWASLVDNIFVCLDHWVQERQGNKADPLFERLATTRSMTLEAAENLIASRREQQAAATATLAAEQELAAAEQRLHGAMSTLASATWTILEKQVSKDVNLKNTIELLDVEEGARAVEELKTTFSALDDEIAKSGLSRRIAWRWATSLGTVILVLICLFATPLLVAWVATVFKLSTITIASVSLSAVIAPLLGWLGLAQNAVKKTLTAIQKLRPQLEAAEKKATADEQKTLQESQAKTAAAKATVAEASARFELTNGQLASASQAYSAGTGRAKLLSFVHQKASGQDYSQHLSFVAAIRKDFEELSLLMAGEPAVQAETLDAARRHSDAVEQVIREACELLLPSEQERLRSTVGSDTTTHTSFERIVLYIDDLDRCPPDKVVEVLQAIHLLLAFPLFVVFVAVDVRWLYQALLKQYQGLLFDDTKPESAHAQDYLEKIFQIPYWVRPMSSEATAAMLGDRMASSRISREPVANQIDPPPMIASSALGPNTSAMPNPAGFAPAAPPMVASQKLRITDEEEACIIGLAEVLCSSPRRVLRFVNSYRLLKATLNTAERIDLENWGYRPALTLLAICVADDEGMHALASALANNASSAEVESSVVSAASHRAIKAYLSRGETSDLSRYLPIVRRFTFAGDGRLSSSTS